VLTPQHNGSKWNCAASASRCAGTPPSSWRGGSTFDADVGGAPRRHRNVTQLFHSDRVHAYGMKQTITISPHRSLLLAVLPLGMLAYMGYDDARVTTAVTVHCDVAMCTIERQAPYWPRDPVEMQRPFHAFVVSTEDGAFPIDVTSGGVTERLPSAATLLESEQLVEKLRAL
jgi:hypothetical protein